MRERALRVLRRFQRKATRGKLFGPAALNSRSRKLAALGVEPDLVLLGRHLAASSGIPAGCDFLDLVARIKRGEHARIPELLNRFKTPGLAEAIGRMVPEGLDPDVLTPQPKLSLAQQKQLLLEQGLTPDDPAVRDFAVGRIEAVISDRLSNYQSRVKSFDRSRALQVLVALRGLLDSKGKRFFLSSGTLLGAVRENGFIASDYDVDVGVFANEFSVQEAVQLFTGTEFRIRYQDPYILCLVHKDSLIEVDIFFYFRHEGMLYHGSVIHKWWTRDFDTVEISLQGESFLVPSDTHKVLEDLYGNWQQPTLFYDLSFDCPYRSYNYNIEGLNYIHLRGKRAFTKGWRYYADASALGLRDFFNLDYSDYIPACPPHLHVAAPVSRASIGADKKVVLLASDFMALDAAAIERLAAARTKGDYLIACVYRPGSGDLSELAAPLRDMRAVASALRGLNMVDAVCIAGSQPALDELVAAVNVDHLVIDEPRDMERQPVKRRSTAKPILLEETAAEGRPH